MICSLLAGLVWAPGSALAQSTAAHPAPRQLGGGLMLGANFSDYTGSESVDVALGGTNISADTEMGVSDKLAAGGFVTYAWNPCWSARVEALFSIRGGKATGDLLIEGADQAIPFSVTHTVRYIEIPVLVQRTIPYDGQIVPRVYAGPSIAVMLTSTARGETVVADAEGAVSTVSAESDIAEQSGRVDVGAMIGAGIGFPAWGGRLAVDARYAFFATRAVDGRYSMPIGDAFAPGVEVTMNADALRNHGLSLFISYEFR